MARYVMLDGPAARETAVRAELRSSLTAARCAARLLMRHHLDPENRELLRATLRSLRRAEHALARLDGPDRP